MNDLATQTDAKLLTEFARKRNEEAFTEVVQRHAPLVLGVCRRVLNSNSDAEDAAQAVFLTLAQFSSKIDLRQPLAPWLHRVAYRVALDAKRVAKTRARHERESVEMNVPAAPPKEWQDLQPLLDEELNNLPEKYRVAVLLHHVEGKTQAETAEVLKQKPGTISMHLNRARELLKERLARKGVLLSAVSIGALMSSHAKAGEVSAVFVTQTGKAGALLMSGKLATTGLVTSKVSVLAQGATQMLFMAKWEAVATIWLAVLVGFAGSFLVYKAVAGEAPQVTVAPNPAPAPKPIPAPQPAVVEEKPAAKVPGQPPNPAPATPPVVAQPGKISDPAEAGGLAIQVEPLKAEFLETETIAFKVHLQNITAAPLAFNGALQAPGISHWPYEVWLRDSENNAIIPFEKHPDLKPEQFPPMILLQPGEKYTTTLEVKAPLQWRINQKGKEQVIAPQLPPGAYTVQIAGYLRKKDGQTIHPGAPNLLAEGPYSKTSPFEVKASVQSNPRKSPAQKPELQDF